MLHLSPCQGVESVVPEMVNEAGTSGRADSEGVVSLEELRHLLYERNELRCRLVELEGELEVLEREKQVLSYKRVFYVIQMWQFSHGFRCSRISCRLICEDNVL